MNKTTTPASLVCAIALALSASVSAQEPVPPVDPVPDPAMQAELTAEPGFEALDKDKDGFIAQAELPPEHSLALAFSSADSNGDSRLDRIEFDAYVGEPEEEEAEE